MFYLSFIPVLGSLVAGTARVMSIIPERTVSVGNDTALRVMSMVGLASINVTGPPTRVTSILLGSV